MSRVLRRTPPGASRRAGDGAGASQLLSRSRLVDMGPMSETCFARWFGGASPGSAL
jgi:hypothetical protein